VDTNGTKTVVDTDGADLVNGVSVEAQTGAVPDLNSDVRAMLP